MVFPSALNGEADEQPRPRALDVRCAWEPPDTVLASFQGEMHSEDVSELEALLRNEVQATGAAILAVDASQLTFVNSIGIGCLARLARDMSRNQRRLVVRSASPILERLLSISGLDGLLLDAEGTVASSNDPGRMPPATRGRGLR